MEPTLQVPATKATLFSKLINKPDRTRNTPLSLTKKNHFWLKKASTVRALALVLAQEQEASQ